MIIMAVDYGDVRTGISVCDKFEMLASPVCVISEENENALIDKICKLSSEYKAERFVVGLPKNMDSTEGERAIKCKAFASALEEKSGIRAVLRDERLTTVSAHNILSTNNVRGKKRKAVVDAVAAVMILQEYLDFRRLNPDTD